MTKENRCKACGKPKLNNKPLCHECFRAGASVHPRGVADTGDGSQERAHGPMFSQAFGRALDSEDIKELHHMRAQRLLRGETDMELIAENDRRLQAITAGVAVPRETDGDKGLCDWEFHLARWKEMFAIQRDNPSAVEIIKLNASQSMHPDIKAWAASL